MSASEVSNLGAPCAPFIKPQLPPSPTLSISYWVDDGGVINASIKFPQAKFVIPLPNLTGKIFILMAKAFLPPGFRFHPTDVELVWYYLKRKIMGKPFHFEAIAEVELYKFAPWDLPDKSQLRSKDLEWYFFCPRDKKYPNGSRTNRATDIGYWKATGRDRYVIHNSQTVGMKKTLVFYEGKPPKGTRTNWVMYEYRLLNRQLVDAGFSQEAYVLCKIFQKSGPGPKTGEQYCAPFKEEDWEDDTITENSFPLSSLSCPNPEPLDNQTILLDPVSQQPVASSHVEVPSDTDLLDADGIWLDEVAEFLNISPHIETAGDTFMISELAILDMNVNEASAVEHEGIYDEFGNLSTHAMDSGNTNHPENVLSETALLPMLSELDSEQYVELNDFCFTRGNDSTESIMPNVPFVQHASTQCSTFQNQSPMADLISYFDNDVVTSLCHPLLAVPDIISEESSWNIQIEDSLRSMHHPNALISGHEHHHLLQEFPSARFNGPFY
ncbi:No apical meristem (NAM) protein [Musa troglodytarum]|uniref:No apical meristem (NAM) protein n=2 Tax=Musa troglodytarum TaxID=320322 RepID=A0A9E7LEL7_9LILI|nr:No apical meristem (NAM) protein [Musa troglodytarum]